jgi:UDP-sulfoquinovose synthase
MRTLVLGMDGYIGWSLSMHLAKRGHTVSGVDNLSRRDNVESVGSQSAIPILDMEERIRTFKRIHLIMIFWQML